MSSRKGELFATYRTLRSINLSAGANDKVLARKFEPLGLEAYAGNTSSETLIRCIREESEIASVVAVERMFNLNAALRDAEEYRLAFENAKESRNAWRAEALHRRADIKEYQKLLGIDEGEIPDDCEEG